MIALALSNLALVALVVFLVRHHDEQLRHVLDRVQAPEKVIEQRVEPSLPDPAPLTFGSDEEFFEAMKERS